MIPVNFLFYDKVKSHFLCVVGILIYSFEDYLQKLNPTRDLQKKQEFNFIKDKICTILNHLKRVSLVFFDNSKYLM